MGGTVKTSSRSLIGLSSAMLAFLLVGILLIAFLPTGLAGPETGCAAGEGELDRVELKPERAKLPVGQRQNFQLKAFDESGKNLPAVRVEWKYSGNSGRFGPPGEFDADSVGLGTVTALISWKDRAMEATATVEVFDDKSDVGIGAVKLEPARLELAVGDSATFTPIVLDARGDQLTAGVGFTWKAEGGVGTIDSAGAFHATAPGVGWVEVEGALFGKSANGRAQVTVREPTPPGEPTDGRAPRTGLSADLGSVIATLGLVALVAATIVILRKKRRDAKVEYPRLVPVSIPLPYSAPLSLPEDQTPAFLENPRLQTAPTPDGSPDLPLLPLIEEEKARR